MPHRVRQALTDRFVYVRPVTVTAYIGLGANLGDREQALAAAIAALGHIPGITVAELSSVRETTPWGPIAQPDYLNAVAAIETSLPPRALLARLLEIECALGRNREDEIRYGPRPIDLDLLVYGDEIVNEPGLEVPHPRLAERAFVLEPLAELASALELPGLGRVSDLLERLDSPP